MTASLPASLKAAVEAVVDPFVLTKVKPASSFFVRTRFSVHHADRTVARNPACAVLAPVRRYASANEINEEMHLESVYYDHSFKSTVV